MEAEELALVLEVVGQKRLLPAEIPDALTSQRVEAELAFGLMAPDFCGHSTCHG